MSHPTVAACSNWAKELQSSRFGALHKKCDNIWSTANLPEVTYVRPAFHQESVSNAVVLHSTAVYDHLKKQLSSFLHHLGNCDIKKGHASPETDFIFRLCQKDQNAQIQTFIIPPFILICIATYMGWK